MDYKNTILAAVVSSGVVSAIVSSIVTLWLKRVDFRNEYYKTVIKKRLDAYEKAELLVSLLKLSILDDTDKKPYHSILSNPATFFEFLNKTIPSTTDNLWINPDTCDAINDLARVFTQAMFEYDTTNEQGVIKAGKKYYNQIASLRGNIENLVRADLLTLHNMKTIKRKAVNSKELITFEVPNRR